MSGQSDEIQVHRRFRGPPSSANGGYVAGLVAEWIEGPAQVDLLAPIPLEVPLHRRRDDVDSAARRVVHGAHHAHVESGTKVQVFWSDKT